VVNLYVSDDKQVVRTNPRIGCILAVLGVFDGSNKEPPDPIVKTLVDEGLIPARSIVGLVFEAAVRKSEDESAFFLDTRHFSVRRFINDRRPSERTIVITVGLATATAAPEGSTVALGNVEMGKLSKGADLVPQDHPLDGFPRYRSSLMPWPQMSELSKAAHAADVAANRAVNRQYMPVTLSLTVSESTEGNKFLLKLGELLESAQKEAAEEISKAILPQDREKTKAKQAEAAEKLYQAELAAKVEVEEARAALAKAAPEERAVFEAKLKVAERKLERQTRLREAAGLPPWPPVHAGGSDKPD
jgi:hypothetical protein